VNPDDSRPHFFGYDRFPSLHQRYFKVPHAVAREDAAYRVEDWTNAMRFNVKESRGKYTATGWGGYVQVVWLLGVARRYIRVVKDVKEPRRLAVVLCADVLPSEYHIQWPDPFDWLTV
jgi:hypothetical protein